MATYQREPLNGGDLGTWGSKELSQNRLAQGLYSSNLYDDSGVLKLSAGKIGINTGSSIGAVEVDTTETISLGAVSSGNWALITVVISGSTASFSAADIGAATDQDTIPTTFTGAYNANRNGYYSTNDRIIGVVWKTAGGALGDIINVSNGVEGYQGTYGIGKSELVVTGFVYREKLINLTDNYTITADDAKSDILVLNFTRQGADKVITLPALTTKPLGQININVSGAGVGNVSLAGSDQINGINTTSWIWHGTGTLEIKGNGSEWTATGHIWDTGQINNKWVKYTNGDMIQSRSIDRDGIPQTAVFMGGFRTALFGGETFDITFNTGTAFFGYCCEKQALSVQTMASSDRFRIETTGGYMSFSNTSNVSIDLRTYWTAYGTWG